MLIDRFLPDCDAAERHEIRVRAEPDRVYAALRSLDLARPPLVRVVLAPRALPARLRGPAPALTRLALDEARDCINMQVPA